MQGCLSASIIKREKNKIENCTRKIKQVALAVLLSFKSFVVASTFPYSRAHSTGLLYARACN